VQKFIIILQSRAIEGSSCEVEVNIDYRQTVTVGSFITKLNTFNWKIDRLVGGLQSTLQSLQTFLKEKGKMTLKEMSLAAANYIDAHGY